MDAAKRAICQEDPFNPLVTTSLQAAGILVLSHFFNLVLKPLGQAGPIAQIMAGIVLGPSLLSHVDKVRQFFIMSSSAEYYKVFSAIFYILFIFLIGLETDIPYMRRNLRKASIVAYGGVIVCGIFGVAVSFFIMQSFDVKKSKFAFANAITVLLANTASPVVIRLAAELKFATADIGRLAIAASLIGEMSCVFWFSLFTSFTSMEMFGKGFLFLVLTVALIVLNKYLAIWINQRNHNSKYVTNAEVLVILFLVIALAFLIEEKGFNSMISCFFIGLMFPREGKTTRTLLRKLNYAVHNFILPIYFGYVGFQLNVTHLNELTNIFVVCLLIFLSFGGKIIGTLAACHHQKIPMIEGILLALLLNSKGHAELLLMQTLSTQINENDNLWDRKIRNLVVIVVVMDTMISGPAVAILLRQKEKYFAHKSTPLELHNPETELRMLDCVYGSRHISVKIGLVFALCGSLKSLVAAYLIHLVELPKKRHKKNLMYHQLNDGDQYSDEEDYGGNDVLEINDAVDAFHMENKLFLHQTKVVSSFPKMYEDVCDLAEDLRVSIIILTFHKHQRLDEKMEAGKEGIRATNQKILRHAPCSVGIFVDRGQTGFQQPRSESVQNIAALFFAGPDDREALACGKMMAANPNVNLTVIRFKLALSGSEQERFQDDHTTQKNNEILMTISSQDGEVDDAFLEDFYNRYVLSGRAAYLEKYTNNGRQTVEALREIAEMYSLFIVGKGGRGNLPITADMSDWEESPELGAVGDLLASSELNINGSVLVIQQHRHSTNDIRD